MENEKYVDVNVSITLRIKYDSKQLTGEEATQEVLQEGDFGVIYMKSNIIDIDTRVNGVIENIV